MYFRFISCLVLTSVLGFAADGSKVTSPAGVELSSMDRTIDPCVDFYQFACRNWIANNPLPADRSRWGRFGELQDRNEKVLLEILRAAAAKKGAEAPLGSIDQKLGDAFASCMDTAGINRRGIEPIKSELERIGAIGDMPGVVAETARLHRIFATADRTGGSPALFAFRAQADAKDSNKTIASLDQAGLSLPDRDYYLKTDAKSVEIRQRFVEHAARMFQLAGDPAETAAAKAKMVLEFETVMARASADRVTLRDPNKRYHILTRAELQALMPGFDWEAYFQAVAAPAFTTLNVSGPDYFQQLQAGLAPQSIEAWRAYFAFRVLRASADRLPEAFENESFDFWQRYLAGAKQPRPREMRCVQAVDRELGDLLGQKYVEAAFGAEAKAQISQLVDRVEQALGQDIRALPWMSEETKKAALAKLAAITQNVGVPKKWRDYSKVTIARDDYFGNWTRLGEAFHAQRLARIGQPTDKSEWTMSTPTVNAYYSPPLNSINFPAGILQFPFFDPKRDMAVNYGGIGVVIGHEMTHGFDDHGRNYDGDGNLRNWWTASDGAEFEKRAACIANEYGGFSPVPEVKLNGRMTLGENTADNGGARVSLMALENALKGKNKKVDGFTPEQRFFIGFAQVWCENTAPEEARNRAMTDPHSPGRFRVNGTVQNMPEFQKAFSCKAGQPMVSANACRVW
jgi:predicted metalloendopeptidase